MNPTFFICFSKVYVVTEVSSWLALRWGTEGCKRPMRTDPLLDLDRRLKLEPNANEANEIRDLNKL